jgi:serine protease Do
VGISVYSLSNSQAKWYSFPSGLYVESIEQTSDAYAKGLRTKDIITAINGIALANDDSSSVYSNFYKEESKYKAGQTITIKVYRTETGNTMTFSIKLEEDKGNTDTSATTSSSTDNSNDYSSSSSDYSNSWNPFGQ